jgi:hypothetical protein
MSETEAITNGVDLIAAERERQVAAEGWSSEHDDTHTNHEIALAAACYAAPDQIYIGRADKYGVELRDAWPWELAADKRSRDVRAWFPHPLGLALMARPELREMRVRELAKAGALIAAEIDRLQRVG